MKFNRVKLIKSPSDYLFLGVEGVAGGKRELYRVLEDTLYFSSVMVSCMDVYICKIPVYLKLALGGF